MGSLNRPSTHSGTVGDISGRAKVNRRDKEGKSVMEEDFDGPTMDACLIASAQRVEHYEMAAYGTLVAWARSMAHPEVADLLEETLDEEKSTDSKLSTLARNGINQKASAVPAAPMAAASRQSR